MQETLFEYRGHQVRLCRESASYPQIAWIDGKKAFLPRYTTSAKKAAVQAKGLIDQHEDNGGNKDANRRFF